MSGAAIDAARAALAGERAWLVGGAVRDRMLGRATDDVDLVVDGDVRAAARRLAAAVDGAVFRLSDEFGAWRVLAADRSWQADLSPLRGGGLEADLALRDLTVNAIAEPLDGGEPVDPTGGRDDLRAGRLRMVGDRAFADDPLRIVRVARQALGLGFAIDPPTAAAARAAAPGLDGVAGERVFAELNLVLADPRAPDGVDLLAAVGALERVLPEITALDGVEQNRYHDADVLRHTLHVLGEAIAIAGDPGGVLGIGDADAAAVGAVLAEPLADGLTRDVGLRWGALLHDAAKPATQARDQDGVVLGFPGHDREGAELSRVVLTRLHASERLRGHVAALARHHLRLGFLVHATPLGARDLHGYLTTTMPVEVDVSLLSVADRLATRGRKADEAIARHLDVARVVLPAALAWHAAGGGPAPLVRGDVLAARLGIDPGPQIGRLLAALSEAQYTGEVTTADEAIAMARQVLEAED